MLIPYFSAPHNGSVQTPQRQMAWTVFAAVPAVLRIEKSCALQSIYLLEQADGGAPTHPLSIA